MADNRYLERGTNVGRYVALDHLGEGGMGVVYRAFDPELDRMVALKLLHTSSTTGGTIGEASWLLREAQALARLSHPNVVIVHDVGVVRDDQVFIAMELVDGMTLRAWLAAEKRSWREVRAVMLAAGAGLAAAHAAKLVHRDFKPDNVIVGSDGRVRVMDFGLARHRPSETAPGAPAELSLPTSRTADLTVVEGVIGTPAYMAPELFDGEQADAGSDQFSFGVVLFEALFGGRPYEKDLVPTMESPRPMIPATDVPTRITEIAVRAVAGDPSKRFASMNELLAVLALDPNAQRRRIAVGLGAITVVALAVVTTRVMSSAAPPPCRGIEQRLAGVWDDATKTRIAAAYVASKLPFAAKAFAALAPALDRYASDWIAMSEESCKATRVRRDQTEDVLSLRQACLDRAHAELAALTKLLAEPNTLVIEKAAGVVEGLDNIDRCGNIVALRAPGAAPPELASKLAEIQGLIIDAKTEAIVSRPLPAVIKANKAVELARATGFQPIIAEAMSVQGGIQLAAGNQAQAEATLTQAAWTAEVGRRDDLLAKTTTGLAQMMVSAPQPRAAEARIWLGLSLAAAKRIGLEHSLDSSTKLVEAVLEIYEGNVTAAVAAGEASFAASEKQYGKDSGVLYGQEILFAGTLARALEYAKAAPHYEHAIATRASLVGDEYPEVALALSNLAVCYHFVGDLPKARATFERALGLREKLFGPRSPILVPTLDNFGVFLTQTGEADRARELLDRGLALAELMPGKDTPDYDVVATDRADAIVAQGQLTEARGDLDALIASEDAARSITLPTTRTSRAQLALIEKDYVGAARFASAAIAGYEAAGGAQNPELWRASAILGRAFAGAGRTTDARAPLERAITIGERVQLAPVHLAPAKAALAALPSSPAP